MKTGMFKQALCKKVMTVLPEWFMEMDIMSGWNQFPAQYCKTKTCWQSPVEATVRNVRVDGTKVKVHRRENQHIFNRPYGK